MQLYRSALPQLSGDLFLTDAGVETDLMFNHGIEIREVSAGIFPSWPVVLSQVHAGFAVPGKMRK